MTNTNYNICTTQFNSAIRNLKITGFDISEPIYSENPDSLEIKIKLTPSYNSSEKIQEEETFLHKVCKNCKGKIPSEIIGSIVTSGISIYLVIGANFHARYKTLKLESITDGNPDGFIFDADPRYFSFI